MNKHEVRLEAVQDLEGSAELIVDCACGHTLMTTGTREKLNDIAQMALQHIIDRGIGQPPRLIAGKE